MTDTVTYGPYLRAGDRVPEGTALAPDGTLVDLSSQWASGPTLLTFLRHFG
jgi:hypothetical protein